MSDEIIDANKKDVIFRICNKHGETAFYTSKKKIKSGISLRYHCKKCNHERVDAKRKSLKLKAIVYKGGSCINCNYSKYQGALEFHHLDPLTKDFNISKNGNTRSWERIKIELDKCILVCSNCHKEIHAGITDVYEIIF